MMRFESIATIFFAFQIVAFTAPARSDGQVGAPENVEARESPARRLERHTNSLHAALRASDFEQAATAAQARFAALSELYGPDAAEVFVANCLGKELLVLATPPASWPKQNIWPTPAPNSAEWRRKTVASLQRRYRKIESLAPPARQQAIEARQQFLAILLPGSRRPPGNPKQLLTLVRDLIERQACLLGPEDLHTVDSQFVYASLLYSLNRLHDPDLMRGFRQAARQYSQQLGSHPDTTQAEVQLGVMHIRRGEYALGRPFLESAYRSRLKMFGPSHPATRESIYYVARMNRNGGPTADSLASLEMLMDKGLAEPHDETLYATFLIESMRYVDARTFLKATLSRYKLQDDGRHPVVFVLRYLLAEIDRRERNSVLAERQFAALEDEARSQTPVSEPNLVRLLWKRSLSLEALSQRERAIGKIEEAIRRQHAMGRVLPADSASFRGMLEHWLAIRFEQTGPALLRTVETWIAANEAKLGAGHPQVIWATALLASQLQKLGRYGQAARQYRRAIRQAKTERQIPADCIAQLHSSFAFLLLELDDRAEAEEQLQRSRELYGRHLPPNHYDRIELTAQQAAMARRRRDYQLATANDREGLRIAQAIFPAGHDEIGIAQFRLSISLAAEGQLPSAFCAVNQAQKILSANKHPMRGEATLQRCRLLHQTKQFDQAKCELNELLRMDPKDAPGTLAIEARRWLARCESKLGNHPQSAEQLSIALTDTIDALHANGLVLSELETLAYSRHADGLVKEFLLAAKQADLAPAVAYQKIWGARRLATRVMAERIKVVAATPLDPHSRRRLAELHTQLTNLTRRGRVVLQPEQRTALLRKLVKEREQVRTSWSDRIPSDQTLKRVPLARLQQQLPSNAAVLDIVTVARDIEAAVRPLPAAGEYEASYQAFVITRNAVRRVDLGMAATIDRMIDNWQVDVETPRGTKLVRRSDSSPKDPAAELRRLVWRKLRPLIGDCNTIIVIPDGAFSRLAWGAIPGPKPNSYLLEHYAFGTADSGQSLARLLDQSKQSGNSALVVGGVDYGRTGEQRVGDRRATRERAEFPDPWRERTLSSLPGADRERVLVSQVLRPEFQVTSLRSSGASEAAVRHALTNSHIVHLATHGRFIDAKRTALARRESTASTSQEEFDGLAGRAPFLSAGLALAGANVDAERVRADRLVNDGILTGQEVLEIDLQHVDLVVLSACQTIPGRVYGNEGVFGLQRAFRIAGARSVVASLWTVEDSATQLLMERFHQNYLRGGMTRLEAMRQAQLALLHEEISPPSKLGGYSAPRYWAAWQLAGDFHSRHSRRPPATATAP